MRGRSAVLLACLLTSACGSLSEKGTALNAFDTKSFWCSGNCDAPEGGNAGGMWTGGVGPSDGGGSSDSGSSSSTTDSQ